MGQEAGKETQNGRWDRLCHAGGSILLRRLPRILCGRKPSSQVHGFGIQVASRVRGDAENQAVFAKTPPQAVIARTGRSAERYVLPGPLEGVAASVLTPWPLRSVHVLLALLCLALPACAELRHAPIDPRTAGMLEFIGSLEAPGGYDAWSRYAAAPPPRPLTTMTVSEVLAWQERIDARSRSEAAGRYQVMEDTLRDYLVPTMGLSGTEMFDKDMQDAMAVALMRRRGWNPNSRDHVAMGNALALEWAALPLLSGPRAGQSAHRNAKGVRNRALATPEVFLAVLQDPAGRGVAPDAVPRSRSQTPAATPRIAGSRTLRIEDIRRTSTRPLSPKGISGGPLEPSRVITFRVDPYAQN